MKPTAFSYFREFFYLFFPPTCPSCDRLLNETENSICLHCESKLAYLNYSKEEENPIEHLFWGQVEINRATAFLQFVQGGITQHLLHQLKYKKNYRVGEELGLRFGQQLKREQFFDKIDYIVPVPLHYWRLLKRGYNQSEMIARGLGKALNTEVSAKNLIRTKSNATQTKKTREERNRNVENIFALKSPELFENKHVLLIDDVVTTGATLRACVEALHKSKNITVSVATIAKA